MHQEVIVTLPDGHALTFHVEEAFTIDQSRAWLDQEFTRLECVPSGVGKVLSADKLLSIAREAGAAGFANGPWGAQYAAAAAGALHKPLIRVDLASMSLGY
jgi:hypothetical protein